MKASGNFSKLLVVKINQDFELSCRMISRNDPPSADAPDRQRILEDAALNERYLRLSLWAQKSLEENGLRDDLSLEYALSEAQTLDNDSIFDPAGNDYRASQWAAAISGVAFILAKHADDKA